MKFDCRIISRGYAEGEALVSREHISFLGGVDKDSGEIKQKSDASGMSVADRIFIFPGGTGSTVGTYVLINLKKKGKAPKAIINRKTETIIAVGAVIAEIPLVEVRDEKFFDLVKTGDFVRVDANRGYVELIK
ncbi:aconitase X swivel domain-containing protein [Archaeoglobus neptunius]|uniref:aconitase X swivel domain-containing protein n=1 Tax=Archaeoglobus neptunius TaxID=2798580 RepID=UPI001928D6EF